MFRDDADRKSFLKTLGQGCERTGWQVHAFILMTNHYHLLVERPPRHQPQHETLSA
jgi:putative transposase